MPRTILLPVLTSLIPTMLVLLTACSKPPDERLLKLSEQANSRQQAQNEVIARQSEKTAELSQGFIDAEAQARQELLQLQKQLVDADAEARKDLRAIHHKIVQRDADGRRELDELHRQAQASIATRTQAVDQQRDLLEQERRQIAAERARAPVVAEAVKFVGGLIVCSLPLVVVVYLLRSLRSRGDNTDAAMVEVLVQELVAAQPRLLAGPAPRPALPSASTDGTAASSTS
jgi:hypothetical protein